MWRDLSKETIAAIAAHGFEVWQSSGPKWRSYAYFTDGKRIGYVQTGYFGGLNYSTVHMPCREAGTGFRVVDGAESVREDDINAALAHSPSWALNSERLAVKKWPNFEAFKKSRFHSDLERVA